MSKARPVLASLNQLLFAVVVVVLSVQPVAAQSQPASDTPESIVLVLKLVSSTHVRPTTGVVISADGMVLVPADFVNAGDEIVVMQGGTDITRNGRSSRTVKRSAVDGLAVLSVDGLERPAITLSEDRLLVDHVYHLAAFPAADKMAEGAHPLWQPVKFSKSVSAGGFVVATETPLPATTGPIIDECGYLVGLNLAESEESVVVLGDEMSVIFDSMQIELQSSTCRQSTQTEVIPEEPVTDETYDQDGQTDTEVAGNRASEPNAGTVTAVAPAVESQPSIFSIIPVWLWLVGSVILIILLAKLAFFLRLTRHKPRQTAAEPDTAELVSTGAKDQPADRLDGKVVIEGSLNATPFRYIHSVNTRCIDIVIGRRDADVCIESPTVSDRHIRLKTVAEALTISDLGSSHGTYIRGIPCFTNEIMMIEPEDEILLGDVQITISIQNNHGDPE